MIKQLSLQRDASRAEVSLDRIAEIYRGLEKKIAQRILDRTH